MNCQGWNFNRRCLMTLSKVFQKSILILGTQGHWNMSCCRGLTDRRMSGTVQENVRDAKAGDSTVPRLRFSCWNLYKSGECLEGLIHTVTLGLLNGEQIVATLTNNKISNVVGPMSVTANGVIVQSKTRLNFFLIASGIPEYKIHCQF